MVSLWPWKTDTSSPASFEKVLSKLSSQLTAATLSLETSRSRARRVKALWTLYTTLTYLLYILIIALVLGPQKWTIPHYAGLAGTPIVIYAVRQGITMFFDWRLSRQQAYIETLQKQRDAEIADLKKATRYDSTQELLQKYGGAGEPTPPKSNQQQTQQGTKRKITPAREFERTGLPPPPTANIPGRTNGLAPATPQRPSDEASPPTSPRARSPESGVAPMDSPAIVTPDEPGFAPNAFSNPPQQARPAYEQPSKWYDRILDLLLGEDETLAKNRIALICSNCRLVNGQAPPGVKSLEEVGRWRCGGCRAWNGVESRAASALQEVRQQVQDDKVDGHSVVSNSHKEKLMNAPVDGVAELDAIEEPGDLQEAAREVSDSEENANEEGICSQNDKDDAENEIKLDEKRVTRSATVQNAKKRR